MNEPKKEPTENLDKTPRSLPPKYNYNIDENIKDMILSLIL